ncbi:MAG: phenylalanine--tRNA ligase subunit beta [Bacilli bacterium]
MRVKLEWLKELVDLEGLSVSDIVERLSLYSIEVESCNKTIDATNIVVGHVLTKEKHPNSDHLNVLTVDVKEEVLQIVCGASNVDKGQYVIVAKVGAVLPGDFQIKRSKIRGVESHGMVCSLQELGIEKKYISDKFSDGIYYFNEPVEIGISGGVALNLHDEVIELGLTPNRGDLLSMIGVSYEVSAIFNRQLKPLTYKLIKSSINTNVDVKIESKKCLAYYAQVIKGVKIKPSPMWLSSRLIAFGVRPINNVVDVTNYILALFGQPLHAFDFDKLGTKIVVRNALDNEEIVTLDDITRKLENSDLVITDGTKPVAIAGVMGGKDTEVTIDTTNLVIESACFDPSSIRDTSTRLGLRSESSTRFTRGVDLNRTKEAMEYASFLLANIAGGTVCKDYNFVGIESVEPKKIKITSKDIQRVLGITINDEEIKSIVKLLSFEINNNMEVLVPNRRFDVNIKEDLIEEIGRIHGYNKLPLTYPSDSMVGGLNPKQKIIRKIKNILTVSGLNEVITYSLVNQEKNSQFTRNHKVGTQDVSLLMPLSEDKKYLRKGLIPSLLEVIKYNTSRKNSNINIFELGKGYYWDNEYHEDLLLAGAMLNEYSSTLWKNEVEIVDFFVIKGVLNKLLTDLGYDPSYKMIDEVTSYLHPRRQASVEVEGIEIGFIGQLHPKYQVENDMEEVYVFEINVSKLLEIKSRSFEYVQISKLPSVKRDIAIVVDKDVLASDIIESIYKVDKNLITSVNIFDIYVGDKISPNQKSIALNIVFSSDEALTEEIISNKIKKVLKDLNYRFKAELRS